MAIVTRWTIFVPALGLLSTPVLAHPGDHSGLTFSTLAGHLTEVDHLLVIALIILIGVLAFSLGRRAERAADNGGRHDPR